MLPNDAGSPRVWQGKLARCWNALAWLLQAFGSLVGRVVLTLLYFTALVPFALIARLFTDPLYVSRRARAAGPRWHPLAETQSGWDEARRQG